MIAKKALVALHRPRLFARPYRRSIEEFAASKSAACGSRELTRHQRRRGEFQNFRKRRDPQHDAAPMAVESGEGRTHSSGIAAFELHRQTAERAMRMRSVGIHDDRRWPGMVN